MEHGLSSGWGALAFVAMVAMMGGMGWMMWSMMRGAGGHGHDSREDPVEILKSRYARGEMTTEEFQERRAAMDEADQGPATSRRPPTEEKNQGGREKGGDLRT